MSLWSRVRSVFSSITVEPAYFAYCFGYGLMSIVSQELYIAKVCLVNLNYTSEICDNLPQYDEQQVEVQRYVASLKIYNTLLQSIPSVIFALLSGSWSDLHGRKFLILTSMLGPILGNIALMINSYFFYELKAEFLLMDTVNELTGGYVVFFMAMNAYMADITDPETRTKRIAFLGGLWPLGFNVGKGLSGLIESKLGFMYNFSFGSLVNILGFAYVLIFVRESVKKKKNNQGVVHSGPKPGLKGKIATLFQLGNIKRGFQAVLKPREHNLRLYILLMVFCFEMEQFINVGEWGSSYLYLRRKLKFDMIDFTRYTMIIGIVGILAQYIFIPIMSEKLKIRDTTIIVMDISGCFINTLILAFCWAEWNLYVGVCISFLDSTSYSMIRCIISKHVRPDEIGCILSVLGSLQAFVPMISSPIFGNIYRATVHSLPQTFLLVLAVLFFVDWLAVVAIRQGLAKYHRLKMQDRELEAEMQGRHLDPDQIRKEEEKHDMEALEQEALFEKPDKEGGQTHII